MWENSPMTLDQIAALAAAGESENAGVQEHDGNPPGSGQNGLRHAQSVLDNRQFNGNAFALLAHAERFLRDTLPIAGRFEPDRFERIDEPLYPPLATREALANALCHRDYSIGGGSIGVAVYDDRLEVTSAGSLHFGLTPEELFAPHESRPWNPLIARTFHRRGIIEEWGSGTLKMAELTSSAGLPIPEIEDDGGCVTVRFRHGQFVPRRGGHERAAGGNHRSARSCERWIDATRKSKRDWLLPSANAKYEGL